MKVLQQEAKDSTKAPDWKYDAASKAKDFFAVSYLTPFGINISTDTIVADYNFLFREFFPL